MKVKTWTPIRLITVVTALLVVFSAGLIAVQSRASGAASQTPLAAVFDRLQSQVAAERAEASRQCALATGAESTATMPSESFVQLPLKSEWFIRAYGFGITTMDAKAIAELQLRGVIPATDASAVVSPETQSCLRGIAPSPSEALLTRMVADSQALAEIVESDVRVLDANTKWRQCLSDLGYDHSDHRQIVASLRGELQTARSTELVVLQKFERELATAVHTCDERGYQSTYRQVLVEVETNYLSSHPEYR